MLTNGRIIITEGMLQGQVYKLGPTTEIGRHYKNTISIVDTAASLLHATIISRGGTYSIKDRGSKNGTFVNGKRIKEVVLKPSDEIVIGVTRLRFYVEEEGATQEVALEDSVSIEDIRPPSVLAEIEMPPPTPQLGLPQASFTIRGYPQRPMPTVPTEFLLHKSRGTGEPGDDILNLPLVNDPSQTLKDGGIDYHMLFSFLRRACQRVNSRDTLRQVLQGILEDLFTVVPADFGAILIHLPRVNSLVPKAVLHRDQNADQRRVPISRTIVKKVIRKQVSILSSDAQEEFSQAPDSSIAGHDIRSAICTPVIYKDEVLGIIYLDSRERAGLFNVEMLQVVNAIAEAVSYAIQSSMYIDSLRKSRQEVRQGYMDTVIVLANAIEARDQYMIGHSARVSRIGVEVAGLLGWTSSQIEMLKIGGLLHDIGKVGLSDSVLCQEGHLSDQEYEQIKLHPMIGVRILKDVPFLKPVLPYILHHHERWDGGGYPSGLRGESIPKEGRLLGLVDAFEAMTSARPYREALTPEKALEELKQNRGTQFDPSLLDAFALAYDRGKLDEVMAEQQEEYKDKKGK